MTMGQPKALPGPHRRSIFQAEHRCKLNLGRFGLREPALLQVPPLLGSTCHSQRVDPVCCSAAGRCAGRTSTAMSGAVIPARSSAARAGARR